MVFSDTETSHTEIYTPPISKPLGTVGMPCNEMMKKEAKKYSEAHRRAVLRYKEKANLKTAQVIYQGRLQYIIDDCKERHGVTTPALLRLLIENDYNGLSVNIPRISPDEIEKWLSPIFKTTEKVSDDYCLKVLGKLNGSDMIAVGTMCGAAGGISPVELIRKAAEFVSSNIAYAPGDIFLRCFEANGGNRRVFLNALSSCGISVYDKLYPQTFVAFRAQSKEK